MELPQRSSDGVLLTEAISGFIAASSRLEDSYRDLQAEVAELSQALSERNRALSESLSENKAMGDRLQHILEAIPCGVLVVAEDGSVWLANPEATRLLALSTSPALDAGSAYPKLRLYLELHTPPAVDEESEQEFAFDRPEGRVWVAIRRVDLPATTLTLVGRAKTVLTLRDITVRKRMEQEREAARDAVALAQLSAILAHEIRNPLASMELFAGLLKEDPTRSDEWLSHLRASIRSLSGTVNNVLTLNGNTSLALNTIDIPEEAALAVEFLQPLARQAEVSLRFLPDTSGSSSKAYGNRGALHQILLNLCANALRHTPGGGTVHVSCQASTVGSVASLRITVTDTGCGIPTDHLPHVFKVGFSGSGASSGLGLAVCDRLARQMAGSLSVTSRVGHGSTFTLEIPQA